MKIKNHYPSQSGVIWFGTQNKEGNKKWVNVLRVLNLTDFLLCIKKKQNILIMIYW